MDNLILIPFCSLLLLLLCGLTREVLSKEQVYPVSVTTRHWYSGWDLGQLRLLVGLVSEEVCGSGETYCETTDWVVDSEPCNSSQWQWEQQGDSWDQRTPRTGDAYSTCDIEDVYDSGDTCDIGIISVIQVRSTVIALSCKVLYPKGLVIVCPGAGPKRVKWLPDTVVETYCWLRDLDASVL